MLRCLASRTKGALTDHTTCGLQIGARAAELGDAEAAERSSTQARAAGLSLPSLLPAPASQLLSPLFLCAPPLHVLAACPPARASRVQSKRADMMRKLAQFAQDASPSTPLSCDI